MAWHVLPTGIKSAERNKGGTNGDKVRRDNGRTQDKPGSWEVCRLLVHWAWNLHSLVLLPADLIFLLSQKLTVRNLVLANHRGSSNYEMEACGCG